MAHFPANDRSKFDRPLPDYTQPAEIGCFSVDINRSFKNDSSQLKYYKGPEGGNYVHFDLTQGYESMMKRDKMVKSYIDSTLHWILENKERLNERNLHTDIVCGRGCLARIMCTPYERNDDLLVAATLYNGTIYLAEFETEQKKATDANMTPKQEEMCYWGYKFEQYLVSDYPDTQPDPHAVCNDIEGFNSLVGAKLNGHSLVFAAEVDCKRVNGRKQYVELKTSREITHPKQGVNFKRYKLIKWWAQSYLVGIPEVICGFRDDNGIVHSLKSYQTKDIPMIASDIRDPWKPNVCLNFLDQFLTFLRSLVQRDDPRVVYLIRWEPGSDITCKKLPPGSEYTFLPDWYTQEDPKI